MTTLKYTRNLSNFLSLKFKKSRLCSTIYLNQNTEYTTPERNVFNDFVRISDTQKYHKYYVETQE